MPAGSHAGAMRRTADVPDDTPPLRGSGRPGRLEDLAGAVEDVVAIQRQIDALTGARLVAVERARVAALAAHDALLADESVRLQGATPQRRVELARRATVAEIACALRLTAGTAERLVEDAATLTARSPATLAGLCAGDFSAAHASVIARAIGDLDPQGAAEVSQACLARAGSTTPSAFRRLVRRVRDRVHPEPLALRHERAVMRRAVWVDPGEDGMAWLTAKLPAVSAHAIHDRLTSTATNARRAGDTRTTAQLRADVLVDLLLDDGTAREYAFPASLAATARTVVPRVHVTVPVLTLLDGDGPAHLDGHGPIDPETARRLTARAPSLRRLLTHPESGAVLSVGRERYTVPADLRAWLAVRDETCRFPGCSVPARRCDVDHGQDFARGGRTDADNLAHLCRKHHVLKHETAWRLEHLADGVLSWTSPTGAVYLTEPATRIAGDRELVPPDPPPDLDQLIPPSPPASHLIHSRGSLILNQK